MPNAGSRISSPGVLGRLPSPTMTSISCTRSSCVADHRAVNADLIGLRRRHDLVGELDLRNDEAVFARELAAHLRDAGGDFAVRGEQRRRQLLAEAQFDLDRLQLLLDRSARVGARLLLDRRFLRRLVARPPWPAGREWRCRRTPSARRAPRTGMNGRPGMTPRINIRNGRQEQRRRIIAELAEHRLFRRAARAALGDQQARGERNDQRGNLRDETVADRQLGEYVGGVRQA